MNLSLIILVLCVIILVSYFIASRMLKKKEGYSNPLSADLKEEKIQEVPEKAEEKVEDRLVLSGTFQSTKNKVRKTKDQKDLKEKPSRENKKKEPAKQGEKRKYSPRKKKEDKGDDLLLS